MKDLVQRISDTDESCFTIIADSCQVNMFYLLQGCLSRWDKHSCPVYALKAAASWPFWLSSDNSLSRPPPVALPGSSLWVGQQEIEGCLQDLVRLHELFSSLGFIFTVSSRCGISEQHSRLPVAGNAHYYWTKPVCTDSSSERVIEQENQTKAMFKQNLSTVLTQTWSPLHFSAWLKRGNSLWTDWRCPLG